MRSFWLLSSFVTRLVAATLGLVLATCLFEVPSAHAQFVCVGNATGATVAPATASGAGATAANSGANVACGTNANASGLNSFNTSTGFDADASGAGSFNAAYGGNSNASGAGSTNTAMGENAQAQGAGSGNTATGTTALASGVGSNNTATGFQSNATGDGSRNTAIGVSANAAGNGSASTAVGSSATATGLNSSAFGSGASATFSNSAAFGNNATATRANQQVFGTANNTYTMSGITSAASRAAQAGPTQIVTSDAGGNLSTTTLAGLGIASAADINQMNARLNDLTDRSNKAFTGVAMAFAMAGVPTLLPTEKVAVAMNWGTFQGTNGLALNAAMRITNNVQLNGGIGNGPNERLAGGRVGVRVGW